MQKEGLFQVAVGAFIQKNEEILILKRPPHRDHAPNQWRIPYGRLKQGEDFKQALKREIKEETSLEIDILYPINAFHFYRGKEQVEHVGVEFICNYISGEVKLDMQEEIDFQWITPENAIKIISDEKVKKSVRKYIFFKNHFG